MKYVEMKFTMTGAAPLLMHAGALADPVNKVAHELKRFSSMRNKTAADYERMAEIEWHASLWLAEGVPCIPAEAIEATVAEAAAFRKMRKKVRAGIICPAHVPINYDGPKDINELWRDPKYTLRVPARVQNIKVMRTRPKFPQWTADVAIHYLPEVIHAQDIKEFIVAAGNLIGVGDWRPRYGRFDVHFNN